MNHLTITVYRLSSIFVNGFVRIHSALALRFAQHQHLVLEAVGTHTGWYFDPNLIFTLEIAFAFNENSSSTTSFSSMEYPDLIHSTMMAALPFWMWA